RPLPAWVLRPAAAGLARRAAGTPVLLRSADPGGPRHGPIGRVPLGLEVLVTLGPIYALGYGTTPWVVGRSTLRGPAAWIVAFLVGWAILLVAALIPVLSGWCGSRRWCSASALVVASWGGRSAAGLFPGPPLSHPPPNNGGPP